MLKTPIKYYGSKNGMINKIKSYFPKDESFDTYIEPFAGSFGIGLTMETPVLIYNDLEKNVYALYKVLSMKTLYAAFKDMCDITPYSEDIRKEFKDKLKDDLSLLDRAFYFFYINRTSHNGIGGYSINTHIRRNMSKSVSDYLSAIDRLPELHDKLSKVIITNKDGIGLIERYNTPNCFLYCDPPYHWDTRTSARYKQDMDRETHLNFLDAVQDSDAKILISGYDCDIYGQLEQSGWRKEHFEVNTTDGKRNKKTKIENVWANY